MAGAGMVLCVAVTGSITVLCDGILCYFRHVKMFVTHYLADYIGESEEIYEM